LPCAAGPFIIPVTSAGCRLEQAAHAPINSTHAGATMNDDFGIREGETAVALPERFDASLYFIGRIRTPWRRREDCPKNARESEAVCTIVIDPRWAQALTGVESCTHLVVLYWMNRSRRDLVLQVPRHYSIPRGTFALRSPARPNPIAMSVVRLVGVDGNRLSVVGLDCLDDTPLLDIKPYFASTDAVAEAVVGWHAGQKKAE
jgi:tRNA-Thr(GGU) m(6)t(6)A37 methyltransferase TsaA